MALPQDGQDANGLTKVTQIPAGKELMFRIDLTNLRFRQWNPDATGSH